MQALGGLAAAWDLWERALIPSLLASCGTWLGDIKEVVKFCTSLQEFYWKIILKLPDSCPKLSLRCETFSRGIKWRIWEEKCLLLIRIQNLEERSLALKVYEEAEKQGWPGLGKDVRNICKEIKLPDINLHRISKEDVQKAISNSHFEDMMTRFESSSKLQDIKNSNFKEMQPYFNDRNLENSRMKFKIRTKMLQKIPGNFKNMYKNVENGIKCDFCSEDMTQNHCVSCPGRKEDRIGLDMSNLDDLVVYFTNILNNRPHDRR